MNQHLSPVKTGLALGKLMAGVHLVWVIVVALGWAQTLINFVLWAHMVETNIVIREFDFSAAVAIVVTTGVLGFVLGYAYSKIYNWLHRNRA